MSGETTQKINKMEKQLKKLMEKDKIVSVIAFGDQINGWNGQPKSRAIPLTEEQLQELIKHTDVKVIQFIEDLTD